MFLWIDPNVLRLNNELHGAMKAILVIAQILQLFILGFAHAGKCTFKQQNNNLSTNQSIDQSINQSIGQIIHQQIERYTR